MIRFSWRNNNLSIYKPFTHYCDQSLDLKQVVNTNKSKTPKIEIVRQIRNLSDCFLLLFFILPSFD